MNDEMELQRQRLRELLEQSSLPRWRELPEIDLYMDQVIALSEKYMGLLFEDESKRPLTPAIVNNYVKMGIVPPPSKKRYNREHLARLFMLCTLKQSLSVAAAAALIAAEEAERPLEEVYNRFCQARDEQARQTAERAEEEWKAAGTPSAETVLALRAGLETLLAERLMALRIPVPEPEKPEKKKKKDETEA